MSSYRDIDYAYPSVGQPKNTEVSQLFEGELCPRHEKIKQELQKTKHKEKNSFQKLSPKTKLERKLKAHDIKMKVRCNKKQIQPSHESDDSSSTKFTVSELHYLNSRQLQQIVVTFDEKIKQLTKDLSEITEENERHIDDKDGLKMTVRRLEEMATRVMKPWINKMPHSDEMTRVLLLN